MTIGLIKARDRAVSQSACNLVHARRRLLIERGLQPSANLLASAARRDLPFPCVTASQQIFLLLHIRTRRRMAIVQEAFHRKPQLIPRAQQCIDAWRTTAVRPLVDGPAGHFSDGSAVAFRGVTDLCTESLAGAVPKAFRLHSRSIGE